MKKQTGTSIKGLKAQNRALMLKLISTQSPISRVEIARSTGLTKMTVGNLVTELIELGFIEESELQSDSNTISGRKPSMLTIAHTSPCICGMLIKRGLFQVILADLSGTIISQDSREYQHEIDANWLVKTMVLMFENLKNSTTRNIIAIGISSIGPIDSHNGTILKPPYFYGIENMPIAKIISEITNLPTYLINDANAGALAEKLYGLGKSTQDFAYLHIMNGIGAGFVFHNRLFDGFSGQSGEIGHTSINFGGPKCACGNVGCLDLYANIKQMQKRIREVSRFYPTSQFSKLPAPSWNEIISAAGKQDPLAVTALEEFCAYISYTLIDTLNLLDLSTVIVGYDSKENNHIIEKMLAQKLENAVISAPYRVLNIVHSNFDGNAPLIGAIATVADHIFSLNLNID